MRYPEDRTPKMKRLNGILISAPLLAILAASVALLRGQGLADLAADIPVSESTCTRFLELADTKTGVAPTSTTTSHATHAAELARLTQTVTDGLPPSPGGGRTGGAKTLAGLGMIDQYIFSAMSAAGVQPADPTNDYEFIRRVTLDLTGRIPTPAGVTTFVNSTDPNKRAALVDQLIGSPAWIDKWTMYFGDLYKNNSTNSQISRYQNGVQAFYTYIKSSLSSNKPYTQMATEMITAAGANSYTQGELNFNAGGVVTGGPVQDIYDQQTANIADVFLGISHLNCLLCHNGKGHLDTLTLWGGQQVRSSAWGMASFLSHTSTSNTRVTSVSSTPYYWGITDNTSKTAKDYQLNTTTGNRPPRQPIGTVSVISPAYIFTGETPKAGENYRTALARMITADPQFARATVNYMWAYFFGVGLVDPPDQFDPLRLDPDNPPPAGWTLQPSNPRLLNALTSAFIANNYDLRWLMRQIVNSNTYQLSSRYDGTWNAAWASLYARKFVRRLWAEEVHDAVATSSGILPTYNLGTVYATTSYAMQFPETVALPDGASGNISMFLDAFLRGNRDDQPRDSDGAIQQGLNMMNDSFVMTRTNPASTGLLTPANLALPNAQLIDTLFMAVLSRHPNSTELATATANLANVGTRNAEAQNLLWSLYNKIDFLFNY